MNELKKQTYRKRIAVAEVFRSALRQNDERNRFFDQNRSQQHACHHPSFR